jgi:hypothetical protein
LDLSYAERKKLTDQDSAKENKKSVEPKKVEVVPEAPVKFDPNAKMDMAALFSMRAGAQNKAKEEVKSHPKDIVAHTVDFLKTDTEA